MRACVLASYFVLLTAAAPLAATLHVCPDGSGDYPNLQAAVAAAASGDIIELCDGVFSGLENVDLAPGPKDLVFRSQHGRDATILDGEIGDGEDGYEAHRAFLLSAGTSTRFEGLTLRNFFVRDEDGGAVFGPGATIWLDDVRIQGPAFRLFAAARGAGIWADGGLIYATDSEFLRVRSEGYGGALSCGGGGAVHLTRCHFSQCSSCVWGAAAYASGGSATDCLFQQGGGPACEGGLNPGGNQLYGIQTVRGCTFRENVDVTYSCVFIADLVEDCLFENNESQFEACLARVATVRNCRFVGNYVSDGGADIKAAHGMRIEGCTFERSDANSGSTGGPGGSVVAEGDVTIEGCTFFGTVRGAALECSSTTSQITVHRTIIAFSGSPTPPIFCTQTPASLAISCTDVFGNAAGDWTGCIAGLDSANGNLSADPLFCDVGAGNLSLRFGSPCAPQGSGGCGLIGAVPATCGTTALTPEHWSRIKGAYR